MAITKVKIKKHLQWQRDLASSRVSNHYSREKSKCRAACVEAFIEEHKLKEISVSLPLGIRETLEEMIQNNTGYGCGIYQTIVDLDIKDIQDNLEELVEDFIDWSANPEIKRLSNKCTGELQKVRDEYLKIIQTASTLKVKDALKYLESLGIPLPNDPDDVPCTAVAAPVDIAFLRHLDKYSTPVPSEEVDDLE